MAEEKRLFDSGFQLQDSDKVRNSTDFAFIVYRHNPQAQERILKSSLLNFTQKVKDLSQMQIVREYENVGTKAFEPKILPGVKHPSPGYPSFKYLNVQSLEPEHKVV
jgi:hypothetical protein